MTSHRDKTQCGFSLAELMVAIVIFGMIASVGYGLLTSIARTNERADARMEALSALQQALAVIERDLLHYIERPARREDSVISAALMVDPLEHQLSFTRHRLPDHFQRNKSNLQRVRYVFTETEIIREFWPVLDRPTGSEPIRHVMLSEISAIVVSAQLPVAGQNEMVPIISQDINTPVSSDFSLAQLREATALNLTFEHPQYGRITRLFPMQPSLEVQ